MNIFSWVFTKITNDFYIQHTIFSPARISVKRIEISKISSIQIYQQTLYFNKNIQFALSDYTNQQQNYHQNVSKCFN